MCPCYSPGGAVSVRGEKTPCCGVPMSWEQYLLLPDKPRAEWVDGVAVIMNAPPGFAHGDGTVRSGCSAAGRPSRPLDSRTGRRLLKLPRRTGCGCQT